MVMRTRHLLARRLNLALLVGTVVILLGSVPAKAVTSIATCPYTISTAGNYEVDHNLTCSGTNGIEIQVSHVYLNLNGHMIAGSGVEQGILVQVTGPLTDIHIVGPGLVQKFGLGILFKNAELTNAEVRNVTLASNSGGGIEVYPNGGSCSGLRLTANVVVSNGGDGILLIDCTDGQLEDNDATINGGSGISLLGGSGNELHRSWAEGNGLDGITIEDYSTNNNVNGNATNGNSVDGISVDLGSTGQNIQSNQSSGNGGFDMDDDNAGCDSNYWYNNTFFTSNQSCIH